MYVNLGYYAKYLIRVHCIPTFGFMGWACPSYLAPCVFDPPLCLSPLPAEAALYGAPALWHSARHQDCSAPGGGGCSAAPALHQEAAQWTPPPTDRTRPAPPLLQPAAQSGEKFTPAPSWNTQLMNHQKLRQDTLASMKGCLL